MLRPHSYSLIYRAFEVGDDDEPFLKRGVAGCHCACAWNCSRDGVEARAEERAKSEHTGGFWELGVVVEEEGEQGFN